MSCKLARINALFSNYRSVISRLWPWDYTPEAFTRVMDEFDYGSEAEVYGRRFRIQLVELLFADVMCNNATHPQTPPLSYEEIKAKRVALMSANGKKYS